KTTTAGTGYAREPTSPGAILMCELAQYCLRAFPTAPGSWLWITTALGSEPMDGRWKFLLYHHSSPITQTPLCHLPNIPRVTNHGTLINDSKLEVTSKNNLNKNDRKHSMYLTISPPLPVTPPT
uniref:Uncharacterized protein n=1 Tax=Oryctolagus cuniculus TaxID=9986 RepID=A0A5F9D147_RABIT